MMVVSAVSMLLINCCVAFEDYRLLPVRAVSYVLLSRLYSVTTVSVIFLCVLVLCHA